MTLTQSITLIGPVGPNWIQRSVLAFLKKAKPGSKARVTTPKRSDIIEWSAAITDPNLDDGEFATIYGRTQYESMLSISPHKDPFWHEQRDVPAGADRYAFWIPEQKGIERVHTSASNNAIGVQDAALVSVDDWKRAGGALYARASGRRSMVWVKGETLPDTMPIEPQGEITVHSEKFELGVLVEIEPA